MLTLQSKQLRILINGPNNLRCLFMMQLLALFQTIKYNIFHYNSCGQMTGSAAILSGLDTSNPTDSKTCFAYFHSVFCTRISCRRKVQLFLLIKSKTFIHLSFANPCLIGTGVLLHTSLNAIKHGQEMSFSCKMCMYKKYTMGNTQLRFVP